MIEIDQPIYLYLAWSGYLEQELFFGFGRNQIYLFSFNFFIIIYPAIPVPLNLFVLDYIRQYHRLLKPKTVFPISFPMSVVFPGVT